MTLQSLLPLQTGLAGIQVQYMIVMLFQSSSICLIQSTCIHRHVRGEPKQSRSSRFQRSQNEFEAKQLQKKCKHFYMGFDGIYIHNIIYIYV